MATMFPEDDEASSSDDEPVAVAGASRAFSEAFASLLYDRTGVQMRDGVHRAGELEAKLQLVARVDGLAGDKVTEQTQVDVSWSAEAPAFRQIVQMMGAFDPNVRCKQFVTGFFKKLVMPMQRISQLDAGIQAFSNLLSLDVSRNLLVDLSHLPAKLQLLHAYENALEDLAGPPLPSLLHIGVGGNMLSDRSLRHLPERWPNLLSLDLSFCNLQSAWHIAGCCQQLKLRHLYLLGNPVVLTPYYRVLMVASNPSLRILDNLAVSEAELGAVPNLTSEHWAVQQAVFLVAVELHAAQRLPKVLAAHLAFGNTLYEKVQASQKARGLATDLDALYKNEARPDVDTLYKGGVPARGLATDLEGLYNKGGTKAKTGEGDEEEAQEEKEDDVGAKLEEHAERALELCAKLVLEVQGPDGKWTQSTIFSATGSEDLEAVENAKVVLSLNAQDSIATTAWLRAGIPFRFRYDEADEAGSAPGTPQPKGKGSDKGSAPPSDAGSRVSKRSSKTSPPFGCGQVRVDSVLTPTPEEEVSLVLPGPPVPGPKTRCRVVPADLASAPSVVAPVDPEQDVDELLADAGLGTGVNAAVELRLVLHDLEAPRAEEEEEEEA